MAKPLWFRSGRADTWGWMEGVKRATKCWARSRGRMMERTQTARHQLMMHTSPIQCSTQRPSPRSRESTFRSARHTPWCWCILHMCCRGRLPPPIRPQTSQATRRLPAGIASWRSKRFTTPTTPNNTRWWGIYVTESANSDPPPSYAANAPCCCSTHVHSLAASDRSPGTHEGRTAGRSSCDE